MGTVAPNSTVYLLKGVPLDNTYENTIYFTSAAAQSAYFLNTQSQYYNYHPVLLSPQVSYQRINEGVLRVNLPADSIYNVNYMMFQNTTQNLKWFYAFVLNVEYVNEQACNVYYEIDVMQTWIIEANLLPSYVEREHVASDGFGEHLEIENVSPGEYICEYEDAEGSRFEAMSIVITHAADSEEENAEG